MRAAYPCGILVHNVSFIGIARSTLDTHLRLRMADVAMYAAKTTDPGMFRFYFPDMEAATRRAEARADKAPN